jgi:hypothetical protein
MREGYVLLRLTLRIRVESTVREYLFTFVLTTNEDNPKKKDPKAISVAQSATPKDSGGLASAAMPGPEITWLYHSRP